MARGLLIEDILGGIVKAASDASLRKTAAVAQGAGLSGDSALLHMSEEDLLKVADRLESGGQIADAAERIVEMRKTAGTDKVSGPSALVIALEMQKIAYRRAAQNLGLIPKTAGDTGGGHILDLMFSGEHPLDTLAEAAAIFELNRLTGQ